MADKLEEEEFRWFEQQQPQQQHHLLQKCQKWKTRFSLPLLPSFQGKEVVKDVRKLLSSPSLLLFLRSLSSVQLLDFTTTGREAGRGGGGSFCLRREEESPLRGLTPSFRGFDCLCSSSSSSLSSTSSPSQYFVEFITMTTVDDKQQQPQQQQHHYLTLSKYFSPLGKVFFFHIIYTIFLFNVYLFLCNIILISKIFPPNPSFSSPDRERQKTKNYHRPPPHHHPQQHPPLLFLLPPPVPLYQRTAFPTTRSWKGILSSSYCFFWFLFSPSGPLSYHLFPRIHRSSPSC